MIILPELYLHSETAGWTAIPQDSGVKNKKFRVHFRVHLPRK